MTDTLYDRLGGPSGIDKLVDRLVDLHLANPLIATRWSRLDDAAMQRGRSMAKAFFAAGSGGPVEYRGRSMSEAHAGMNISDGEFMAVLDDIVQAMSELGYPRPVCDEVLGIAYSLKGEILRK
jgi:hemoglobin